MNYYYKDRCPKVTIEYRKLCKSYLLTNTMGKPRDAPIEGDNSRLALVRI